ncbi:MAG: hypothetical protein PHV74_07605 [Dehalococcoidia bacterium]|nr:hypothetical protein [Dehalococcoidia bacterium]
MGNERRRRLWDREFDVVKDGLDEAQVIAYVEELHRKYDEAQQIHVPDFAQKQRAEDTLADAEKIAREIEEQSRIKALEMITEAEAKLQEVLKAKKITETKAQSIAIDIIAKAEKKRQLIEEEAQAIIETASREAARTRNAARHPTHTEPAIVPDIHKPSERPNKQIADIRSEDLNDSQEFGASAGETPQEIHRVLTKQSTNHSLAEGAVKERLEAEDSISQRFRLGLAHVLGWIRGQPFE